MKTLFLSFLSLFLTTVAVHAKSVPAEILSTVIEDTVKSRIPDLKDPKLLASLVYDIAMGKPERFVEDSFESFKPDKIRDDAVDTTKMEILKLLVPGVAVYVETAKQVFGVVETYVNDWEAWAINNRAEEFKDEVLSKTTVKELDSIWNEYLYGGGMTYTMAVEDRMRGVFGHNIKGVVAKMKEAYEMRRKELERKEKLKKILQERAAAKERAIKQLLNMKRDAEKKVSDIIEMMDLLKIPSSKENVEKHLKDKKLYADLRSNWQKEIDKKKAAGEAVKTGDQETDSALNAAEIARKSVAGNTKDNFTPPDYSGILREYGLNSDRLLTNNVSGEEYQRLRDLLMTSAWSADQACTAPYWNGLYYSSPDITPYYKDKIERCQAEYKKFGDAAAEIDARLNEYGAKLKSDLDALTMNRWKDRSMEELYAKVVAEFNQNSFAKNLEKYDSTMYDIANENNYDIDYDHWLKYSWEGRKNPDLKTMEKYRNSAAGIAGAYETLVPLAEEKARDYRNKVAEYETLYKSAMNKYYDLYQQNSSMAAYFGAEQYDFKMQLNQFSFAQTKLNEPFMSESYINAMRGNGGRCRTIQEKWNLEIDMNKKFLAEFGTAAKEFKALAVWTANGGTIEMNKANFEKHYNASFKAPIEAAECGINGLWEAREGFINKENAVKGGCYLTVEEHRKKLSFLDERVNEVSGMNFYAKLEEMYVKMEKMEEALKKIPVNLPSGEIEEIKRETDRISTEFGLFSKISDRNLAELHQKYKKALERAEEVESNLLNFACQSSSVQENKDYLSKLPWKVSDKVEKYCLDETSRPKIAPGAGNMNAGEGGNSSVRKLYDDFKQAYEGRNVSRVMAFIDQGWTSQDGSEISDLEEHLSRIFRVFNEISFSVSNLNISDEGNGNYTVSYDLHMTSKIYSKNIKREEKSSVTERVRRVDGKLKIFKTENGSYWLIK